MKETRYYVNIDDLWNNLAEYQRCANFWWDKSMGDVDLKSRKSDVYQARFRYYIDLASGVSDQIDELLSIPF